MRYLFSLVLIFVVNTAFSQSPIGVWKNIDDEDGKAKSHIRVYEENGKLHGKVIRLLEEATIIHCNKCTDHRKDKPIQGMVIMNDLVHDHGSSWGNGHILDPKSGKTYKCNIELNGADELKVRGYIGVPMFGRTQKWYRVSDSSSE